MMAFEELPELLDYYFYLESSLIDTIQIIPLENNATTYSPKLYDIFRSACSQFESLLKMIFTHLKLSPALDQRGIMQYYKPFNEFGLLYWQRILFRKYPWGSPIYPFRSNLDLKEFFTNKSKSYSADSSLQRLGNVPENYCKYTLPVWWTKHNVTKHVLPEGYKEGNLQNTCFSLAGLYAFHVMANYLKHNPPRPNFLDPTSWYSIHPHRIGIHGDKIAEHMGCVPKSKFFIPTVSP